MKGIKQTVILVAACNRVGFSPKVVRCGTRASSLCMWQLWHVQRDLVHLCQMDVFHRGWKNTANIWWKHTWVSLVSMGGHLICKINHQNVWLVCKALNQVNMVAGTLLPEKPLHAIANSVFASCPKPATYKLRHISIITTELHKMHSVMKQEF